MSSATLDRLAMHVAPAIGWLAAQVPGPMPPPPASDVGSVRTWLAGLSDPQLMAFLDSLPPGAEIAAIARVEMTRAPAAAVLAVPPRAPDRTVLDAPHVDRDSIWSALLALWTSENRLLMITGDARRGKTHTVALARTFVDFLGPTHAVIAVELEARQSVEAVALDIASSFTAPFKLLDRAATDSTTMNWAIRIGRQVFNHVRAAAGAGVTPWLVFDHFERMPPSGEAEAFFNELATQIALVRKQPTAPRLILIDHRTVPPAVERFTLKERVETLTVEQLADYLHGRPPRRPLPPAPPLTRQQATDEATLMMARVTAAAAAADEAGSPNRFMDFLVAELEAYG